MVDEYDSLNQIYSRHDWLLDGHSENIDCIEMNVVEIRDLSHNVVQSLKFDNKEWDDENKFYKEVYDCHTFRFFQTLQYSYRKFLCYHNLHLQYHQMILIIMIIEILIECSHRFRFLNHKVIQVFWFCFDRLCCIRPSVELK